MPRYDYDNEYDPGEFADPGGHSALPDLRPAGQPEAMSVDAKLELAKYTLAHLREWTAGVRVFNPETGKRISNRALMEHLTATIDNCLRAVR